jgi:hypothetical protein
LIEWQYPSQPLPSKWLYQTDSDWGEDKAARKSTTSCHGYFGKCLLETIVSGQAVIALSSGEAEFYALGNGASCSIMLRFLLGEFGVQATSLAESDSSAARGIARPIRSGKLRHLAIRDLWVQEKVRAGELKLEKTRREDHTSDLGTKRFDLQRILKLAEMAGLTFGAVARAVVKGLAASALLGQPAAGDSFSARSCDRRRAQFRGSCVQPHRVLLGGHWLDLVDRFFGLARQLPPLPLDAGAVCTKESGRALAKSADDLGS